MKYEGGGEVVHGSYRSIFLKRSAFFFFEFEIKGKP
jgi:hypothetical protein